VLRLLDQRNGYAAEHLNQNRNPIACFH
jgi:hypothetical protein